jgi:hypothetical protein
MDGNYGVIGSLGRSVYLPGQEPEAQAASNFLWRCMKYIEERRPFEGATIAILREKAYDIMDECVGKVKSKEIN